tara:strand:- start:722 stop:961 length:240 start_codon:yes stop_codon:yes gene_type:complete
MFVFNSTSSKTQHQQNTADYMQYLYKIYDRANAEPGLVGTYTGLYQAHCDSIGRETVEQQVANWHREGSAIVADWICED